MKISINIENYNEINKVPNIRELIVLSHIVNANHSLRDQFLRIDRTSQTPASKRDILYGMLQLSSFTYEGMQKANSILMKLAEILPRSMHSEIAWLHKEVESPDSYYNRILAPIRNELGFHFSHSLANLPLHESIPNLPPILAESNNEDGTDLIYILPTDIMASYFLSLTSEPSDKVERLTWMITHLGEYNNRIMTLLRDTVYALIQSLEPRLLIK